MNALPPDREPVSTEPEDSSSAGRWLWVAIGILLVIIVVLLLVWLSSDGELVESEPTPTVDDVVENTDEYLGETISLSGRVVDVFSERAFTITADEFESDLELLVVTRRPVSLDPAAGAPAVVPGAVLQLTGEVRNFERTAMEQEIGTPLSDALVAFDGEPVLLADRVYASVQEGEEGEPAATTTEAETTTTTEEEITTTTVEEATTTTVAETTTTVGGAMFDTTVEELASTPEQFYGNEVRVTGAVAEVLHELAFALAAADAPEDVSLEEQVLVVTVPGVTEGLSPGATVRVTGQVRPFDDDFRASVGALLGDAELGDWEGRPAIIVTSERRVEIQ